MGLFDGITSFGNQLGKDIYDQTHGVDVDWLPGLSVNGGARNTVNNAWFGQTAPKPAAKTGGAANDAGTYDPTSAPLYNGSWTGGGGIATAAAPSSDPDTAAYYQDMMNQLQGQNGRLDGQLNTGLSNLQSSYNTQANRLGESQAVANRNYDTQTQQNMQGYSNTRNGIISNTRSTNNALQRLLGLNGAGNSSAALEQAPYAAGLQGSQNLSQAQQNYSTNMTGIKTAKEDADRNFKHAYEDLDSQKYQQENSLRSTIAQTRASLLDKIAQAGSNKEMALGKSYSQAQATRTPYQQQINSLLDQITGLGSQYANPVLRAQDVALKQADLGDYSLGKQAQIQNQGGGAGNLDPTFLTLLTQKDKERNNPLGF
jgi:hypothetical protein